MAKTKKTYERVFVMKHGKTIFGVLAGLGATLLGIGGYAYAKCKNEDEDPERYECVVDDEDESDENEDEE